MIDVLSALVAFDRLCSGFVAALQHSEWQVYPTLALALTVAFFTFPPRNDLG
ncbi:MAG TPA: hypothetical protein VGF60_00725 [Xanthobacteraceae bacterium]|jgi:hypothetical protein